MIKVFRSAIVPLAVVALSVLLILPYFHTGFFSTHDGEWAVVRLADMFRTLRDGQFPVRYSGFLNHGYGYPLFNFTYPFPYYFGVLLHFLKFGFVDSIKIIFAGSVVASGLGMYLLAKEFWKSKWAGLFCAALYLFLPYRIVDLYARGSIGESTALAIFPWLLYFCLRQNFVATAFLFAALITAHNIMAVYFSLVLALFFICLPSKRRFLSLIFGVGLAAFFIVPAIFEKGYISLSQTPIADRSLYFLKPLDLILPKWGYGVPDSSGGFGYQLGWPQVLVLVLVTVMLIAKWRKKDLLTVAFAALVIVFLALLFPWSAVIWQVVPLFSDINYPWTLLAPLGFLVAFLSGWLWQFARIKYLVPVLSLAAAILVIPHARAQSYVNYGDNHYLTNDATTTSSDELLPLWVKVKPSSRPDAKVKILSAAGQITDVAYNSRKISFRANLNREALVWINTIYYPGWQAFDNGKVIPIAFDNDYGIMNLVLPAGNHGVSLKFTETPLRWAADIISLASLGILTIVYLTSVVRGSRSEIV